MPVEFYKRDIPKEVKGEELGVGVATRLIAQLKKVYPYVVIKQGSDLYNAAVVEYNNKVRNSTERPPLPDWYCGAVDNQTGLLKDEKYGAKYRYDLTKFMNDWYVEKIATYDINGNIVER